MMNTYPKVKKPDLPPLILPDLSLTKADKELKSHQPQLQPNPPSITRLNPIYTEDIISSVGVVPSNRGKRVLNWLSEMKHRLPTLYKILIIILIGIAIPIILPALGALPALGIA